MVCALFHLHAYSGNNRKALDLNISFVPMGDNNKLDWLADISDCSLKALTLKINSINAEPLNVEQVFVDLCGDSIRLAPKAEKLSMKELQSVLKRGKQCQKAIEKRFNPLVLQERSSLESLFALLKYLKVTNIAFPDLDAKNNVHPTQMRQISEIPKLFHETASYLCEQI